MYSKQEAARLKQEFWTAFGLYMTPVLSADGEKVHWVNYKTGEKHFNFRLSADQKQARVAIVIDHRDALLREIYYEELNKLSAIFNEETGGGWTWNSSLHDEFGKEYASVYKEIFNVNIFKKEDWPTIISFLKQQMIALDAFWSMAKYQFEVLPKQV